MGCAAVVPRDFRFSSSLHTSFAGFWLVQIIFTERIIELYLLHTILSLSSPH